MKKKGLIIASALVFFGALLVVAYNILLMPTSTSSDAITIDVVKGSTYLSITKLLKEHNLIKSELAYKIYLKLSAPQALEAGKYQLTKQMGVKKIITILEGGSNYNADTILITVPEGKSLAEIAAIATTVTNNEAAPLMALWDSPTFIDKVIDKYWFITDDIKKSGIRHPLEGYFFPSTYELLHADVDGEYIAYKFLDQMAVILEKYKDDIMKSQYNIHELLTLASIIEKEAILDEDRPIIASVFYNRLKKAMLFGSCATVGYAIDDWKLTYTAADLAFKSPYNTYINNGFPIGPIDNASEGSIKAAIYPTTTNYLYFLADVCHDGFGVDDKVYYSTTLSQHEAYGRKYLSCY